MTTTKRALLAIDIQNDFCEGGALAVAGGSRVAEAIAAHVTENHKQYDLLVASQDWHLAPPETNCGHFALNGEAPDFVNSWPVHCVQHTAGAALHPAFRRVWYDLFDALVLKGSGTQSYSAFEGVTSDGRSLLAILRSAGITDIDVVGIATDYCIRASVMDALGCGFGVRVLEGMIAGVDQRTSAQALWDMKAAGAKYV